MKKILLFCTAAFVLAACHRNDDDNVPEIDKLPAATHEGKNTAGCLVDGKAFLPKGYIAGGKLNCFYQGQINFGLSIGENKDDIIRSVGIHSHATLEVGKTYQLVEFGENLNYGRYSIYGLTPNPNYFFTPPTVTGELTITYHNYDKAIISGTFWFDAVNSEGKTVQVREGRFDMEY